MSTYSEKLQKEKESLVLLLKKKEAIEDKIKKCESNIVEFQDKINLEQYSTMSEVLTANGISLDDLLSALQNRDLKNLTEKINPKTPDNTIE